MTTKVLRNDTVLVRSGKDRGKKGKVVQIFPEQRLVVVEGVNKIVRHLKSQQRGQAGQKLEVDGPIPMANVALVCPSCSKPTRVGYKVTGAGVERTKQRVCKQCDKVIAAGSSEQKKAAAPKKKA
ncbi:MAG: 50S ribosomal protein L24 [Candidatus Andersenbacteria bacterium]